MATTAGVKVVGLKKAMDRVAAYNLSRAKPTLEAAALASAPGEVPTFQSENLIQSLNTKNVDSGSAYIGRAHFGAGAEDQFGFPYALALEFGYGDLAARPYMRPSISENEQEIADAMVAVCNAEWRRLSAGVGS